MRKKKQEFPRGWNEKKVRELIAYYENQTDDQRAADIEASPEIEVTMMEIPNKLVPQVRALLARKRIA
jgi:hypothetical protein